MSTMNDELSRLDGKRNTGQSIQNDLVEVYVTIFDSVFCSLVKAGYAPMPWDGKIPAKDSDSAPKNIFQMFEIQIGQRQRK